MSKKTNYYRQKGRADAAKGVYRNPNTWGDIGLGDSSDPEDGAAYDEGYYEKKRELENKNNKEGGCFPATAEVLTPNGERSIATVSRGDVVLSFDLLHQKLVERLVTKRCEYGAFTIWKIEFGMNRAALRVTGHHTLLTQRNWVRVDRQLSP
jgi:hypothetical protein